VSNSRMGASWRITAHGMSDLAQSLPWGRDESELITELQAGSEAAFDWLVTHYHSGVYNLVYGILSDSADAADVTQEVFLRAFRGIRDFRRGSSLKTWLYRISVRQALNHRRWCWRHHRQQISIDAEEEGKHAALDLKDCEANPFERFETQEMQTKVRAALAQVPEIFRGAVILRDLEDLSYEEVAEVMEVSVGTVKSRILRGRRLLKEILDPLVHAQPQPARAASTLLPTLASGAVSDANRALTPIAPPAAATDLAVSAAALVSVRTQRSTS
jgi:RNA polymerase sigma-70 factor, ECF subfamily